MIFEDMEYLRTVIIMFSIERNQRSNKLVRRRGRRRRGRKRGRRAGGTICQWNHVVSAAYIVQLKSSDAKASKCHLKFSSKIIIFY